MTTALFLLLAGWSEPTPDPAVEGLSTYYAPGLMAQVIENRGLDYADGVALNACGDLNRPVWLLWPDSSVDGPLPVVDCAQEAHYQDRIDQGRVVEVSARLARERGFYGVGPASVTVLFDAPLEGWR